MLEQDQVNIILKAKKGDEEAFKDLYNTYYNNVYFIAMNFFHDDAASKDIVQETFIYVYKNINSLRDDKAFKAWISKIAYSKCLNELRKSEYKNRTEFGEDNDLSMVGDDNELNIDSYQKDQLMLTLLDSLEKVPDHLRGVGLLRFYEDLSIKEIADVLSIPEGTVKRRISDLKKALKNDLEKKGITPEIYAVHGLTPTIILAYTALSSKYLMNTGDSKNILVSILGGGGAAAVGAGLAAKIIASIAVGITLVGTGFAINGNLNADSKTTPITIEDIPINNDKQITTSNSKITAVEYSQEWVNHEVDVNVKTSNNDYNSILINGASTSKITENGDYTITLNKDGKVVDEKTIKINNIDLLAPKYTYSNQNEKYIFSLSDDLSGVDYNRITCLKDNVQTNDYQVDKTNNTISIDANNTKECYLKIYDQAGNNTEIMIKVN